MSRFKRALVLAGAVTVSACNNSTPTVPTNPTQPNYQPETFDGSLTRNAGMTHPFSVSSAGLVTATIQTLSDSTMTIGLSLGLNQVYNGSAWVRMVGSATDGVLVNLGSNNDVTVSDGSGALNVIVDSGTITVSDGSGALNVMQERIRQRYSCGAQVIPGLLQYGDVPEIGSLIAPRYCVWEAGARDGLIKPEWAERAVARMRRAYRAYGAEDRLLVDRFEGGHRWNGDVAYPLLDKVLKPA